MGLFLATEGVFLVFTIYCKCMNYFRIAVFGRFSLRRLADFYCGVWPKTASGVVPAFREIRTNKLFATLSCIVYILDIISPGSNFRKNIKELIKSDCRLLDLEDMGFPKYWQSPPVWREKW